MHSFGKLEKMIYNNSSFSSRLFSTFFFPAATEKSKTKIGFSLSLRLQRRQKHVQPNSFCHLCNFDEGRFGMQLRPILPIGPHFSALMKKKSQARGSPTRHGPLASRALPMDHAGPTHKTSVLAWPSQIFPCRANTAQHD